MREPAPILRKRPPRAVHASRTAAQVRPETPADQAAIRTVLTSAFPGPAEADLVERLRDDGDVVVSLVAVDDGQVVGHVLLSKMSAPFKALGLAPLAVAPARQGEGIGARLVKAGLEAARDGGWEGVFLLGDPAYYGRFGFSAALATGFSSPYAGPHFMAISLSGELLPGEKGDVGYARAFSAL
jgi:putative acetyltransferase